MKSTTQILTTTQLKSRDIFAAKALEQVLADSATNIYSLNRRLGGIVLTLKMKNPILK
jgi:hypothetical protein